MPPRLVDVYREAPQPIVQVFENPYKDSSADKRQPNADPAAISSSRASGVPGGKLASLLLQASRDAVWIKHANGDYAWVNEAFLRLVAREGEDVSNLDDSDLWTADCARELARHERETLQNGNPQRLTTQVRFKNRPARWLEISRFVHAQDGQKYLLAIARDMTSEFLPPDAKAGLAHGSAGSKAKPRAKGNPTAAQEVLEQFGANVDSAFWLKEGARLLYASPVYQTMLGLDVHRLYEDPESFVEAIDPRDRSAFLRQYKSVEFQLTGRLHTVFRITRADGAIRWINLEIFPIKNASGQIYRHAAISRDVTDQRVMTQDLELAKQRAEALNRELMLINAQLEDAIARANEMAVKAETASQSKSQFLANMSHEIRTPLNAVLGMITLMEQTELSTDQSDFMLTVRQSSETLLGIINDILDFSKIEAGKVDLENIALDLPSLIVDTVRLLEYKAEAKGLELKMTLAPELPVVVSGDPTRLRQVLFNLIGNAIKFTEVGGIHVQVVLENLVDGQAILRFMVEDTGIGIPKERLDLLFKPFSQMDPSTTRKYGGSGLGLAISARLVQLMSGEIWVESTEGKGSCFYFRVVLSLSDKMASPMQHVSEIDGEKPPAASYAGLRVLLAEDNPVNRKVATLLLKRFGVDPDVAVNGLEAVEAASRNFYDIILMDVQMPEMDGLDAAQAIRESPKVQQQPYIIALTASVSTGDRERCLAAGMNSFLSKPIRVEDLARVMAQAPRLAKEE